MSPDVARTAGVPKSAAAVEEAKRAVVEEAPQLVDTTAPAEDKAMADTVAKLTAAATDADRKAAAAELVAAVQADGVTAIAKLGLDAKLKAALAELKNPVAREGALVGLSALAEAFGKSAEPYLVPFLGSVLDASGDKAAPVRAAADAAGKAIIGLVGAYGISMVLPALFEAMDTRKTWQTKCSALNMLALLNTKFGDDVARRLEDIVPVITSPMCDAKEQVKTLAFEVMSAICKNIGNRDVEAVIPAIISCLARPLEVQECVHKLGATTFVQNVESPVLSMLVPLLIRGLRERSSAIKRKSAVIIDNMAKLVDNPADALVFLPRLLPEVELVANEAADPELRNTANKAKTTLEQVRDEGAKALQLKKVEKDVVLAKLHESLKEAAGESGAALVGNAAAATVLEYMAAMASDLVGVRNFDAYIWKNELCKPFLPTFIAAADSDAVAKALLDKCYLESSSGVKAPEEEQWEGEDLCDCEFSLAYGGKILLNNARLHLKRGQRYGLCGPNGAGKSTLMRAIANGQLDGFPPKDVLRTVYVEHDIDGSKAEMVAVEFVFADDLLKGLNLTLEQVQQALTAVGFPDEYQQKPVASLSGGWKMKLALARAMLTKPDIMLLDEPTNHLDVVNVAWLQNYLVGLKDVSSIIVSHDSSFLDFTCTGIIHYENRKLKLYKGNLSKFVAVKPEAKSYYSLADTQFKFTLPEPGFLEGIKTKDRAILKVLNISYKYPGTERNIINNATVYCSLSSRVAVVGANGAGKSTLIKVLTGEVEPDSGSVWKHPNLRIAYVAQHAFHHIEQHLEKTPNEYIQWRYATGEDREGLEKESRKVTDEEAKKMAEKVVFDGQKLTVEKLLARRKAKKGYEYEVQWLGKSTDATTWLTRDVLESMGFTKMVNEIDIKEAAAMGLYSKPLTAANIQKHLENIGLEAEFGTHSQMRGLSGGQKVKVVLAAATWMNPHLIVLDEPTNYLDRDSLGALAGAIKEYGGGVVMITHNSEFSSALCPETWVVADGRVDTKGDPAWQLAASKEKVETKQQEETTDAYGNTIKIKGPKKKLSNKEKKAYEKLKKARRERGEEVSEDEEDS